MNMFEMHRIDRFDGDDGLLDRWSLYRLGWQDQTTAMFLLGLPDVVEDVKHIQRVYWSSRRVNEARESVPVMPVKRDRVPTRYERPLVI